MDVGTAMSVAQTLLAALQCSQLKEICSIAGYKSKLDELRRTVVRIKAVLKDAEAKQELSEQEQLYIEELKDAVYEADDLFDEFVTLAERKQLTKGIKVRVLSVFTKFGTAYKMTQGVKKIKNKLDAIAFDKRFSLSIDPKPIKSRRLETCAYVYEADIIGRELDLEKIVGVLLDSNVQQNVSFLSIVGIGGLGKTALAQLVYNDTRITSAFPLRLWTCVSDENEELLDVRGVLDKILASATSHKMNGGSTMDALQRQLREQLAGKKYLLVLDDVWTENYERWHTLKQYLIGGQKGSWIVVTTRSHRTAEIIGDSPRHDLQGLSKENSWCLFKRVAFGPHHSSLPEDLVNIGKDIVEDCVNVPLAIRVMGSLLHGQDKQKWLSVQKMGLAKVKGSQNSIMPTLMLSYYQLESPLKSCFGYCAIFPKDHVMEKGTLIRLWMAQGYIAVDDHQSPEDLAEEYFSILLRRCFFQDVKKDEYGNIRSCKIHDLMHDVAQEVMGKEISLLKTMDGGVDRKVCHLALTKNKYTNYSFNKTQVRSFLQFSKYVFCNNVAQLNVDALVANWKYLRALDLTLLKIKSLPGSIGDLIHLRYLNLTHSRSLEVLPGSITKLGNLQTLILFWCRNLKELPKDLTKLVKLRVLDLIGCDTLRYMPRGMGKLTCLHTLTWFVVGGPSSSKKEVFDGLENLKALKNLKGCLNMKIQFINTSASGYMIHGGKEGSCLGNKEHLKEVVFDFGDLVYYESDERQNDKKEYDEALMEELQPHSNLKSLEVWGYQGVRMPQWALKDNLANCLPYLVHLTFGYCINLQYLEQLKFAQLKKLQVFDCPDLIVILECPALENLELVDFNERLEILPVSGASSYDIGPKLREVKIDNMAWLKSLPMNPFRDGAKLVIEEDREVESLGEAKEVFRCCSSSLKYLEIKGCRKLKSVVSGGLEHLSALEDLTIVGSSELSESEKVESVSFCQSLHSLSLGSEMPNWIQHLTSLQRLVISGRVELPKWMSKLTSLRFLQLPKHLKERCQQSTGEYWPLIQHIAEIKFTRH